MSVFYARLTVSLFEFIPSPVNILHVKTLPHKDLKRLEDPESRAVTVPDPSQPASFPQFNSLPPELRLMIWRWALALEEGARRVDLEGQSMARIYIGWVSPTRSLIPALLLVNREARAEALRRYPNSLRVYRDVPVSEQRQRRARAGRLHMSWHHDAFYVGVIRLVRHGRERGAVGSRHGALGSASFVSKGPKPADEFRSFQSLPPELRLMIWDLVLDLEERGREVNICQHGVQPTKSLISPLLLVNAESRSLALSRYPDALPVWHYQGLREVQAGVVYISWPNDAIFRRLETVSNPIRRGLGYSSDELVAKRLWVPALITWLYQHSDRCYYRDPFTYGLRPIWSCIEGWLALGYLPPLSDAPPPNQGELDLFFKSMIAMQPDRTCFGQISARWVV
ncbi:hypothetical protein PG993_011832 [Apiospora rasikravindrae]|uniref:2EXR domain-containing protein n=1 Tax=Apiospora rasikravindrae TaxID=990691 RepID=A0ABR1S2D7_9PEZI